MYTTDAPTHLLVQREVWVALLLHESAQRPPHRVPQHDDNLDAWVEGLEYLRGGGVGGDSAARVSGV